MVSDGLRRSRLLRAEEAFGALVGLIGLCLLVFAGCLFGPPSPGRRALVLAAAGGAAILSGAWFALRGRDSAALSALFAIEDPRLRSAVRSAVELRRAGGRGFSPALLAAHAQWADERASGLDVSRLLPGRRAALILAGGALIAVLDLVLALAGPPQWRDGFAALIRAPTAALPQAGREPITGDIELTLLYPAHTHRPPKTVSGTSGEVSAPAGTQVRLATRADRDIRAATLVVNGTVVPLSISGKRELSGSFVISRAGSYFFRFFDASGRVVAEGPPVSIAIEIDAPPRVTIDAPKDLLEVDARAVVDIRFQASDDYGLSAIALVDRPPGGAKDLRIPIRQPTDSPTELSGDAFFDLGPLRLAPGDHVTYTIEATDNDAVSGPKSTRARAQTLVVFSEAEHHRAALAEARALWERLVGILGDRLVERQADGGPLRAGEGAAGDISDAKALSLCDDMERAAQSLRKDRAAPQALGPALRNVAHSERARASLTSDARGFGLRSFRRLSRRPSLPLDEALDEEIAGLERDTLYLEALLDRQTMLDLVSLTKELQVRRRELARLLERYRSSKTPELKAQVQAELARLRERVQELMARMSELAKGLSDEHLNQEALAQLEHNRDIGGELQRAGDELARGDIEGAKKALDELGNALDEMEHRLKHGAGQPGQQYPELAEKLEHLERDLGTLADAQRKLARETDAIRQRQHAAAERQSPTSGGKIERLRAEVAKAQSELRAVPERMLPPGLFGEDALGAAREKADELQRALGAKDLDQALRSAQEAAKSAHAALDQLGREQGIFGGETRGTNRTTEGEATFEAASGHLGVARAGLEEVRQQLAKLFPKDDQLLSPADRHQLGTLSQRQQALESQLGNVRSQMKALQEKAPLFDPSASQQLGEAGSRMGEAQGHLAARRPDRASEAEQDALRQLDSLEHSLEQGRQGGGQGGSGFPMPFASSDEGEEGSEEGNGSTGRHEKVVIPDADQYRVPPEFRRDLLDAMKQKPPTQYEEQVKKYYQEIVR
ncbi:MAG: DUF4175 family protein [Deltaproteobacteria bacterium]